MAYAYIYLLKTKTKRIVKTENIIDFKKYTKNPSNTDVYYLHEDCCKKSCIILLDGETRAQIDEKMKAKRVAIPKINDSAREDDILDSENESDDARSGEDDEDKNDKDENDKNESDKDEDNENENEKDEDDENKSNKDEEETTKVQRKKLQAKRKAAKQQMAESIIEVHKKARAEINVDTNDMSENIDTEKTNSRQISASPTIESTPSTSRTIGSTPSTSRQLLSDISNNNQTLNREENLPIGTIRNGLVFLGGGEWEDEKKLKVGTVRSEFIYLGEKVWVREAAFKKAKACLKPSLFVTKLAYAIWGYEALANRNVANIANREERPLLEENKVLALTKQFELYLKNRKCDQLTTMLEIKNINSYLGTAIGGARKKLKNQRRNASSTEHDNN